MSPVICGYYGKLPLSPEFLRLHAAGPELRWLDDWLQRGTLYAKTQEGALWQARVTEAVPYSFVYIPAGEGRTVSGVVIASQDKAGRAFPFLSFVLLDRHLFASSPWLLPVATAQFLKETTESIRRLRASLDWAKFCQEVEERQTPDLSPEQTMELLAQFVQSTTIGEWWPSSTMTCNDGTLPLIVQTLQRIVCARGLDEGGIRFPILPHEISNNLDLAFWLRLCLQPTDDGWNQRAGLVCLWSRVSEKSSGVALVSIGPGTPNIVRFIVNPEAQDHAWRDVMTHIPDLDVEKSHRENPLQDLDLQASLASMTHLVRDRMGRTFPSRDRFGPQHARR